jgi:hypothetical protein
LAPVHVVLHPSATVRTAMSNSLQPALPLAVPNVRGVYCLREPLHGLWAYYAVTSDGRLLHEPRPCEIGLDTAFVVHGLREELDLVDPVEPEPVRRPFLTILRSVAALDAG